MTLNRLEADFAMFKVGLGELASEYKAVDSPGRHSARR